MAILKYALRTGYQTIYFILKMVYSTGILTYITSNSLNLRDPNTSRKFIKNCLYMDKTLIRSDKTIPCVPIHIAASKINCIITLTSSKPTGPSTKKFLLLGWLFLKLATKN